MTTFAKGLTVLAVILAIGIGLVVWKAKIGSHGGEGLTKVTKEDMQFILKDTNPMTLKRLAEDPESKKKYAESLQEFLAVASAARKEGLTNKPQIKSFLDFIRAQVVASSYDKQKNKDKGQLPPFSFIKKEDIEQFYQSPANEEQFNQLIKAIVEQGKEDSPDAPDPTPEQTQQLKDQFAKVKIYEKEAGEESAKLGDEFEHKTELQVKLQQAAFLNQLYSQKVLAKKVEVSDEEVKQYIAAHPEFDPQTKKAKAEEILQRAKAGEDFAKLADELSEDPGTKGKGGLYEGVRKGQMLPEFEQTALALEPGKIADAPVQSKYGYHIIKLEKKRMAKDKDGKEEEEYDVRHILVSTMFVDPKNPRAQPMPVADKVKANLQEEKGNKILDEIKAKNPIEIEEFEVPKPSDEQLQQMQEQMMKQQQMPELPEDLDMPAQGGGGSKKPSQTKKPAKK